MSQETIATLLQWLIAGLIGLFAGFFIGKGERLDRHAIYQEGYEAGVSTGKAQALAEALHNDLQRLHKDDPGSALQRSLASAASGVATDTTATSTALPATLTEAKVDCSTYPFDSVDRARCVSREENIDQTAYQAIQDNCEQHSNNRVYTEQCVQQGVTAQQNAPRAYYYQERRPTYRIPRNP